MEGGGGSGGGWGGAGAGGGAGGGGAGGGAAAALTLKVSTKVRNPNSLVVALDMSVMFSDRCKLMINPENLNPSHRKSREFTELHY